MSSQAAPSPNLCLTAIDSAGIQNYVFGSNNLKQIAGASGLVHWVTHEAVWDALIEVCGADTINLTDKGELLPERQIEKDPALQSERIYSGGGNTVLIFRTRPLAEKFARTYSEAVLRKAPRLELVLTHLELRWIDQDPTSDSLAEKVQELLGDLAAKKRARQHLSTPLLGLGVTADCQYTGLPAVAEMPKSERNDAPLQRVSAEARAKRDYFKPARERLHDALRDTVLDQYDLIDEFDDLGEPGESSYMAVVHLDGNGMGKRVQAIAEPLKAPLENRAYIDAMRAFSESIEESGRAALNAVVAHLIGLITRVDGEERIGDVVRIREKRLPFRPILFGGDDTTFVCDGRLALRLAHLYLEQMEQQTLSDGQPLYGRAGVAVVGTHYPFARAYTLAEELAASAKKLLQANRGGAAYAPFSALDWHFAVSGPLHDLDAIRTREYREQMGHALTARPLLLQTYAQAAHEWRTWPNFAAVLDALADPKGPWIGKRNKVKALRDALRQGNIAVGHFLTTLGAGHARPPISPTPKIEGWRWEGKDVEPRRLWYDAIEALEFNVPPAEAPSAPSPSAQTPSGGAA